jgi:S-DNA-T family DNA segregation ATPase FtsK/SpoIIIE
MARIGMQTSKTPILPQGTGSFFRRRLAELAGAAGFLAGIALFLALISYTPSDPSLNSAVDGPVHNLLYLPGAWIADLLLQALGIPAVIPAAVVATWGWRLMHKQPTTMPVRRLTSLFTSVVFFSSGLAIIPTLGIWPMATQLGGVVGMASFEQMVWVVNLTSIPGAPWIVAGLCFLLGTGLVVVSFGIDGAKWRSFAQTISRSTLYALRGGAVLLRRAKNAAIDVRERRDRSGPALDPQIEPNEHQKLEPSFMPNHTDADATVVSPNKGPKPEKLVDPKVTLKAGRRSILDRQGRLEFKEGGYRIPPLDLLEPAPESNGSGDNKQALEQNARLLESVLEDFGVRGEILRVRPGPVVTLYELEPAPGTKTARVISLADDIARSMSAVSVRIAVIPGRNVIGLELPNARRDTVHLRELLASDTFERANGKLLMALGKDISGAPIVADLSRMPHLLIAGTTGSGKSVGMNAMVLALLYQLPPEKCRMIMIDPKMLELSVYEGIPHLLTPVVTEPGKAVVALKWTVREMEERYRAMSQLGVRNIAGYNARLEEARGKNETLMRRVQTGFDPETGKPVFEEMPLDMEPLPFIVVVVDEMADLMLVAGKDVEAAIQRLAQMARAAGIHLIMATQRPSVDVITGTIKANFPTRISFQVTSKIDSRTILGEQGAEQLLGQGDMLYMVGGGRISRVHGPFVSDEEVERVVSFLKLQGKPDYLEEITVEGEDSPMMTAEMGLIGGKADPGDELFDQAVALIAREGKVSTSFIQRHLQIGYNRAARIVERMEADSMISKPNRVGRREVLLGRASTED